MKLLQLIVTVMCCFFIVSCGNRGSSLPSGIADPAVQNGGGGAGAALSTPISAAFVLFQNDWLSKLVNRDGGLTQKNGVAAIYSIGAYADANDHNKLKLFVNDRDNNRVLIFNSIPTDGTAVPDVVVGQFDFMSGGANAGGGVTPNANGFDNNVSVSVCTNGMMFVADRNNHRVLGFNTIPRTNGATADFVLGQADFVSNTSGVSATAFNQPYGVHCIYNQLLLVDKINNRVLVYDPIPTATNTAASLAIGQPDLVTNTEGCTANKLAVPYEVLSYGGGIYIADGKNHRVLGYSSFPVSSGAVADVVVGQVDMTSCLYNQTATATPSDKSLYWPNSLARRGNELAISDHSNNRVMFFALPLTTNQAAFAQLGQPDFVTATYSDPPTSSSVGNTKGLVFDDNYIWVSDGRNRRLGVFPLPY